MREIKLRTWDKKSKKWLDSPEKMMGEIENIIIIQYTGLKDKNGKEIWEGDVLEYDGEKVKCKKCGHKQLYYSSHKLYEIKWNQEMCEFVCENDENSMNPCIWGIDMKIIGNIYENPDLLSVA